MFVSFKDVCHKVLELGCWNFDGIIDLEHFANDIKDLLQINIEIFGFTLKGGLPKYKANKYDNYLKIVYRFSGYIAAFFLIFVDPIIALLCLSVSLFGMNIHNLIGLRKYQQYMWVDIVRGILLVLLPLILFHFFDFSGIIIGMMIAYFITSFQFLKSITFSNFSFNLIKKRSRFLLHNFGVDLGTYAPKFFDKLLIYSILDFSSLGIYQLNLQILFGLEVLPTALHSFLLSEKSRGISHRIIIVSSIIVSILIAIVTIIISPFIISEFFPKYVDGITSLQFVVLSIIPLTSPPKTDPGLGPPGYNFIRAIISAKLIPA